MICNNCGGLTIFVYGTAHIGCWVCTMCGDAYDREGNFIGEENADTV